MGTNIKRHKKSFEHLEPHAQQRKKNVPPSNKLGCLRPGLICQQIKGHTSKISDGELILSCSYVKAHNMPDKGSGKG